MVKPETEKEYESHIKKGDNFSNNGSYESAKDEYERALKCIIDDEKKCKTNEKLGEIYYQTGDYEDALTYFIEAERIAINNHLGKLHASIRNHIGNVYIKKFEFENGKIEFIEAIKSIDILLENRNLSGNAKEKLEILKVQTEISLSVYYFETNNLDDAQNLLQEIHRKLKDDKFSTNNDSVKRNLGTVKYLLGSLAMYRANEKNEENYFHEAIKIGEEINNKKIVNYCHLKLGEFRFLKNNPEEALDKLKKLTDNIPEDAIENKEEQFNSYFLIAQIYSELGNFENCLDYILRAEKELQKAYKFYGFLKIFLLLLNLNIKVKNSSTIFDKLEKSIHICLKEIKHDLNDEKIIKLYINRYDITYLINTILKILDLPYGKQGNETKISIIFDSLKNIDPNKKEKNSFSKKKHTKYIKIISQNYISLLNSLVNRPQAYKIYSTIWNNRFKRKFINISEYVLNELVFIEYNFENTQKFNDCTLKLANLIEYEIKNKIFIPLKEKLKNEEIVLYKGDYWELHDFKDFIEDEEDDEIKFSAMESILNHVCNPDKILKKFIHWKPVVEKINNCFELIFQQIRTINKFLHQKFTISNREFILRKLRNDITHPTQGKKLKIMENEFIVIKNKIIGDEYNYHSKNTILNKILSISFK